MSDQASQPSQPPTNSSQPPQPSQPSQPAPPTSNGPSQKLRIDHYILDKTLGEGGFGKVKLAIHEYTGSKVAIKIINKKLVKSQKINSKIQREIRLMKYFNHPNMIKLYQVLDTMQNIFVVMEYVPGGELFDLVNENRGFDENIARKYFRQIIDGLEYCHQNLVCHRDIKLENILVNEKGLVKIADFGLSNFMKDGQFLKTSCGSLHYAAPEVVLGKQYTGAEVDIWSCGIILYAMLTGTLPFEDDSNAVIVEKITKGIFHMPKELSPEAQDLLSKLLKVHPMSRLTIPEIKRHPWFMAREQSALVLKDYSNKDESTKVNEWVLSKLIELEGFDYKGLRLEEIREAIRLKRNYSFVVGYELLHNDYVREVAPVESHADQLYFGPVKDYLDLYQREINKYYESLLQEGFEKKWQYGVRLPGDAEEAFSRVIQTLAKIPFVSFVIKSSSYNLKCNFNPTGEELPGEETMTAEVEGEPESDPSLLQFSVQLFRVEPKLHLVDVKRSSGSPLSFLDFCATFRRMLKSK